MVVKKIDTNILRTLKRAYFEYGLLGYFKLILSILIIIIAYSFFKNEGSVLGFLLAFLFFQTDYYFQLYVEHRAAFESCKVLNSQMSKDNLELIKENKKYQRLHKK